MKNSIKLTMAIAGALLLITVCSAQAAIVIDRFDEGEHFAPPRSEIAVQSAIGGYRLLDQISGANPISVLVEEGFLISDHREIGGKTKVEWNGDGGLGGIDLTAGDNNRFQLRRVVFGDIPTFLESLTLRVTDTDGGVSNFTRTWDKICRGNSFCLTYEIPFSSLSSGADLTAVDIIALEFSTDPLSPDRTNITIDSFQVVPIPGAVWLLGSGLLGVIGLRKEI